MIKKQGNKYYIYDKEGKRKLSKGYTSPALKKRMREIEYFKHTK